MGRCNLPKGWVACFGKARWRKPYGWCARGAKRIDVHPPKWIPRVFGLRGWFTEVIYNHECLHAWGNPGCSSPWCLGYEGRTWQEYLAMPLQLAAGLRFCGTCKSYYKGE